MASADEITPLLGDARAEAVPPFSEAPALPPSKTSATASITATVATAAAGMRHRPHLSQRQTVEYMTFAAIFLLELGMSTMNPAVDSKLQDIICHHQFGHLSAEDPRCRLPAVQRQLASTRGSMIALSCIPAIILTLPFGILADKIGRRPVLMMGIVGVVLDQCWMFFVFHMSPAMPPWTVYFSSLFDCIGSFPSVGPAMLYTMLGDVTPQAERATVYFRVGAVFLVADLLSNPLSGALLLISNWATLLTGTALIILCGLVITCMPETLNFDQAADAVVSPQDAPVIAGDEAEAAGTSSAGASSGKAGILSRARDIVRADAREAWVFIFSNQRLVVLMLCFSLLFVGRFVQDLQLQYASKRYNWSWSHAAFLLTIGSSTNLLLCLVILPTVDALCIHTFGMSPLFKDLFLARISASLLLVGTLLIASAATPLMMAFALVVFSMGCGFHALTRSLLNAFVEAHHQAILNSLLGLLEFTGLMVASPVLYGALEKGIDLGGPWIGLPFLVAAGAISVGLTIVCAFRIPPEKLAEVEAARKAAAAAAGGDQDDEAVAYEYS